MPSASWCPILTSGSDDYRNLLQSITESLSNNPFMPLSGASLGGGSAGVMLFFLEQYRATGQTKYIDRARQLLMTSSNASDASFYAGSTGIAWAGRLLAGLSTDDRSVEPTSDADVHLIDAAEQMKQTRHFDLCQGLTGLGVEALDRWLTSGNDRPLKHAVDALADLAETSTDDTVTWRTSPTIMPQERRELYPNGYFDLGVAHGVPGVIAFLALVCAIQPSMSNARSLLGSAVQWLLAQRLPGGSTRFPHLTTGDEKWKPTAARAVTWCYGDLGVASALFLAGRTMNEWTWQDVAVDIARNSAAVPVGRSGVVDACVCHGAAGTAHLFNCFYQATREDLFAEAARRWLTRTIEFSRDSRSGPFHMLAIPGSNATMSSYHDGVGVMYGIAGVGLALIAALHEIEPVWDRMLLLRSTSPHLAFV